jgi:acyl-coenzyme A synthetase/AMP-(fatty) acid ligase
MQSRNRRTSLWSAIGGAGNQPSTYLCGAEASVCLGQLVHGSSLSCRAEELRDRSVLVATADQLAAALTLIELDGVARRLVLCPPDVPSEHLSFVIDAADVDAIVSDQAATARDLPRVERVVIGSPKIASVIYDRSAPRQTEWILLTSGTTGVPKLVAHSLASLAGAIERTNKAESPVVWSTFYDIRRYGGLQIFLRAILTGASLVLSGAHESTVDFLSRAGAHGVTHISGTPSHWRRALMSPSAHMITPQYVRLSGEIADQGILNHLQSFYREARVAHAFASTEAGVAFDVTDGLAGFPASLIGKRADVEMKVQDGSLRVRSTRIADRYLGQHAEPLTKSDGFVDTRDMLELRGDRYYFVGRRDGVINVGGLKVHPEEVEAVINRHTDVQMSLVRTRKNPITGALVVADVVLKTALGSAGRNTRELQSEILLLCREELPSHKVPASINFVPALAVAETGKLVRQHA